MANFNDWVSDCVTCTNDSSIPHEHGYCNTSYTEGTRSQVCTTRTGKGETCHKHRQKETPIMSNYTRDEDWPETKRTPMRKGKRLIIDYSGLAGTDAEEYNIAWSMINKHITKCLEFGATSGKTTLHTSVPDGYGGGSEQYNYTLEWKLEDV